MGDEELNFTEEEAQCWARDPRNQGHEAEPFVRGVVICLAILVIVLICVWLSGMAAPHEQAVEALSAR